LKRFEEVEDDAEVTKTLTLQEVYKNLVEWTESLGSDLNSQYSKGCLIPIKAKELKELAEETGSTIKMLPTKLVAVLKKKVNEPTKKKSRIVACGNMDQSEEEKETYAGGADATAVRSAIRIAALRRWSLRTKDVSTAFLNADYKVKGEILALKPPNVYLKAGLVEEHEYWLVKKAIYGLKESPYLWAVERDTRLSKMKIEVPNSEDPEIVDKYFLKKLQSDPNTWHILKEGEEQESKGLLLTYVDDILVATSDEVGKATMKAIDDTWKCSAEEIVQKGVRVSVSVDW
jgi:hypothetical protein